MNRLIAVIFLIHWMACAPLVKTKITKAYPTLDYRQEVNVVSISQILPKVAVEVGTLKIGDSGLSSVNCEFEGAIGLAKLEARKAGGNVLQIVSYTSPNPMKGSCYQIKAKIFRIDDPLELKKITPPKPERMDDVLDYAKIYVYRADGEGSKVDYDLHLGNQLICKVKNASKHEIRIAKVGLNMLWAKTELRSEIPIQLRLGRAYYLRCSLYFGATYALPKLQLVDPIQGRIEYDLINS